MRPQLTAPEVLERLHLTRRLLGGILAYGRMGATTATTHWRSGQHVVQAIGDLGQYAERRLHRHDVAEYAADVQQYAHYVLGELLAAAPAREV